MNILVIAAHADDEVLGCGATIAKYKDQGAIVNVALLADGVSSRYTENTSSDDDLRIRNNAARDANKILGVDQVLLGEFPDNRMDSIDLLDVVQYVEGLINEFRPDVILTHHSNDLNIDHYHTFYSTFVASRPNNDFKIRKLLSFEIKKLTQKSEELDAESIQIMLKKLSKNQKIAAGGSLLAVIIGIVVWLLSRKIVILDKNKFKIQIRQDRVR
mgnify:CR=1 FL=1